MIRSNLNSDKYIQAGLDIGSDKICCAISEIDLKTDTTKLLGLGNSQATSINRGAITHRDNLIDEIDHAIGEACTMSGISIENLALGISGEHIRGINTQGAIAIGGSQASNVSLQNEITKNDVKKVLDLAKAISLPMDRDILHVLPQEYVIDTMNSIKDPIGLTGRRLEAKVHVITVATTAATNLVSCVEELGIRVENIIYQGLASSLSTLTEDEKKLGAVCVDIGASTTDIVIYSEDGIQHTATLGIGSASITNDIAVMLQIGIDEAEKMGADILIDGRNMTPPKDYENGYWLGVTILDNVNPDWSCAQEEIFGPVLSIIRTDSLEQAMKIENGNAYGNAAAVFTTSGEIAKTISENASAGMIGINIGVPVPREPYSFGGWNESKYGHGDITGKSGVHFWTNLKKVTARWPESEEPWKKYF